MTFRVIVLENIAMASDHHDWYRMIIKYYSICVRENADDILIALSFTNKTKERHSEIPRKKWHV